MPLPSELRQAGAEIEVTPEMIEAGEKAVQGFFSWELDDPEKIARAVFLAMIGPYEEAMEDQSE